MAPARKGGNALVAAALVVFGGSMALFPLVYTRNAPQVIIAPPIITGSSQGG